MRCSPVAPTHPRRVLPLCMGIGATAYYCRSAARPQEKRGLQGARSQATRKCPLVTGVFRYFPPKNTPQLPHFIHPIRLSKL